MGDEDPFTTVLHLEDTLYTTAYAGGVAAGARAGRIEGRIFGLEKGFEKFASLGVLHGRACVWGARTHHAHAKRQNAESGQGKEQGEGEGEGDIRKEIEGEVGRRSMVLEEEAGTRSETGMGKEESSSTSSPPTRAPVLPFLPRNPRLEKHISTLHALTEPLTFSTLNTEDAVADLDERFKRAGGKVKIIERMAGEGNDGERGSEEGRGGKGGRRGVRVSGEGGGKGKGDEGMEDFSIRGARGVRM